MGKSCTIFSYNTMWPCVGKWKEMTTRVIQTFSGIRKANPSIIGKDIARFKEKYDINIGLKRDEVSVARQKKEQFMLVDNFVFNVLTVK